MHINLHVNWCKTAAGRRTHKHTRAKLYLGKGKRWFSIYLCYFSYHLVLLYIFGSTKTHSHTHTHTNMCAQTIRTRTPRASKNNFSASSPVAAKTAKIEKLVSKWFCLLTLFLFVCWRQHDVVA